MAVADTERSSTVVRQRAVSWGAESLQKEIVPRECQEQAQEARSQERTGRTILGAKSTCTEGPSCCGSA